MFRTNKTLVPQDVYIGFDVMCK